MTPIWYRQQAFLRWPTAEHINAFGRYALVARVDGVVKSIYLFTDREVAEKSRLFYDSSVYDLEPCPFPENCRELGWEEPSERRARRKQSA